MTTGRINQVAVQTRKKVNPLPDMEAEPVFDRFLNIARFVRIARDGGPSDTRQHFPSVLVFSGLCTENSFTRTVEPSRGSYTEGRGIGKYKCALQDLRADCRLQMPDTGCHPGYPAYKYENSEKTPKNPTYPNPYACF